MPFGNIQLNDGSSIPEIAFGTGSTMKNKDVTTYVEQALKNGFSHIDTAQIYGTEQFVGTALQNENECIDRKDLFVTTKFGGGKVIHELQASLDKVSRVTGALPVILHDKPVKLKLKYVDLYLIHVPQAVEGSLENTWREMEKAKKDGLTKSIGVSNFSKTQLEELINIAHVKPAVNQIKLHPYNWDRQREVVEYAQAQGIVIEAYSPLYPITTAPHGPLDPVLNDIAKRHNATPAQILFAWVRSKGAIIITTTRKVDRLNEYIDAGDIEITKEESISLDRAAKFLPPSPFPTFCALFRYIYNMITHSSRLWFEDESSLRIHLRFGNLEKGETRSKDRELVMECILGSVFTIVLAALGVGMAVLVWMCSVWVGEKVVALL